MNVWEAIAGIILLVAGVALFLNSYNQLTKCNSSAGQFATAIADFFGNNGIPACNNAAVYEVVGAIGGLVGLVLLILGAAAHQNKA